MLVTSLSFEVVVVQLPPKEECTFTPIFPQLHPIRAMWVRDVPSDLMTALLWEHRVVYIEKESFNSFEQIRPLLPGNQQ